MSEDSGGPALYGWAETADRTFRWVLLVASVMLIAVQPFGLASLRYAALGLLANLAAYIAFLVAPGDFRGRLLAIVCFLAIASGASVVHPLYFSLFAAFGFLALILYCDTRIPLLGGALGIACQAVLAIRAGTDWQPALVAICMTAATALLCAMLSLLLRRQVLLLAAQQQRIPQLEAELETAQHHAGQALRIKHDLLANLSHEIRTPLNGVLGMTRLLMDTRLSAEQRELSLTLERSTTALLDIMNEVIDFSALESGRVQLDSYCFEFHRPFEDVMELLGPMAQGKGLEMVVEFDSAIPLQVVGDARRLRQVLLNVIGNALKFTESGHILVRTSVEETHEAQLVIRTEVADTGPGISQEDHGRIFQPFAQGKTEHAAKYGGAGLGLTISKRLVEMMGGDIGFKSNHGKGTRFWFTVPCLRLEQDSFLDTSALSGVRVLALSRYPIAAGVAASQLRLWGIDAFAASQPDAALAELLRARQASKPYDIVVLDGEQSGPNTTTGLLDRIRTIGRIPSVGVLPFGQWSATEQHGVFGFDAIVTKPLRPSQLWKALCVARFGPDSSGGEADAAASMELSAQPTHTHCILLVEDNPINQKVAKRMVEKLGYTVAVAANGRVALEMINSGAVYAAVLMDCMMPEMDGFEATREIREKEREQTHLPIIALTAHALHAEKERCLKSGMDDYITKPVHLEVLRQTLERWVPQPPRTHSHANGHS